MTVTATGSAPVPGDNRRNLADEPTLNLPVQRTPNAAPASTQIELGRRVWDLNHDRKRPLGSKSLARRFGVTEAEIDAAQCAYLDRLNRRQAVRPSDLLPYRKPSNSPAVELGKRAYDVMARNDRARRPSTVEGIAVTLGVDQAELMDGMAAFVTATTGVEFKPSRRSDKAFRETEEIMWWNV